MRQPNVLLAVVLAVMMATLPYQGAAADTNAVPPAPTQSGQGGDGTRQPRPRTPPPPPQAWTLATGTLAFKISECGTLTLLSSRPDRDMLIAGIAQRGMWASTDGGATWVARGVGSGSATIVNRTMALVYDPEHPDTFWQSGIYNGPGVYQTTDGGETFKALGNVTHNDLVAVDFSDPERKTLLAGGHETANKFFRSSDGGQTWTDIGDRLPAGSGFSALPAILSADVHLIGTYASGSAGIFRTENGGTSWTRVYRGGVVNEPVITAEKAIYWLLENGGGVVKSTDLGRTWSQVTPPGVLRGRDRPSLVELPGGKLASLSGDHIIVSSDGGASWREIGPPMPYDPAGLTYSRYRKMFYIWHFTCGNMPDFVLPDAIAALPFDYEAR